MTEFEVFDKAFTLNETDKSHLDKCLHVNTDVFNGILCCMECGQQLHKVITHNKEWIYYGHSYGKNTNDQTRVHLHKTEQRTIFKDIANMGFSEDIICRVNEMYSDITKNHILRGDSRKSLIFACVYYVMKNLNMHPIPTKLMKTFGLSKKNSLKGLKMVNMNVTGKFKLNRTTIYSEILYHIKDITTIFSANDSQQQEILEIYKMISNKSSKLNRSRPHSLAASIVFYWIETQNQKDLSLKKFAQKVELSELTINKIVKEIYQVMEHLKLKKG